MKACGDSQSSAGLLKQSVSSCRSVCSRLGSDVFHRLYESLKEARQQRQDGDDAVTEALTHLEDTPEDGLQVDQLLFYEEELQRVRRLQGDRPSV